MPPGLEPGDGRNRPYMNKPFIAPASKHAQGCHSGLDPESSTVMDYEH
jgi:hypothetical protein